MHNAPIQFQENCFLFYNIFRATIMHYFQRQWSRFGLKYKPAGVLFLFFAISGISSAQPFTPIRIVPPAGSYNEYSLYAIIDSNNTEKFRVVGDYNTAGLADNTRGAAVWTATGFLPLPVLPGMDATSASARVISQKTGQMYGSSSRRTPDVVKLTGWSSWGGVFDPTPGGYSLGGVNTVNSLNTFVAGGELTGVPNSSGEFVVGGGGIARLLPRSGDSAAGGMAINDSGVVVGGQTLWASPGNPVALPSPGVGGMWFAINNNNQAVGFTQVNPADYNDRHAVLTQNGTASRLPEAGALTSNARGINDAGVIVGSADHRAVMWKNGAIVDLNIYAPVADKVIFINALAITASGAILIDANSGTNPIYYVLLPTDPGINPEFVGPGDLGVPITNTQPRDETADPVSATTGAFHEKSVDLHVNGPLPIEIRRSYSSLNYAAKSEFGYGWLPGYSSYLIPATDASTIRAADIDGSVVTFRQQTGSTTVWSPTPTDAPNLTNSAGGQLNLFTSTIVKSTNGGTVTYQWNLADGSSRIYTVLTFPITVSGITYNRVRPFLTAMTDSRGNSLSFSYGSNSAANEYGRMSQIQSSNGSSVTLTYDAAGHVTRAAAADGRTVNYSYSNDNLEQVVLPDGAIFQYQYAAFGHVMTQVTNPEGRILENTYDNTGRVIQQFATVDQANSTALILTATFDYSVALQTTILDAYNRPTVYRYTAGGLITNIADPLGQTIAQVWYDTTNPATGSYANSLQSITDKRGLVTAYKYDAQGNTIETKVTGNLTGDTTTTQTATTTAIYNARNLPTSVTDASGVTTSFAYADATYPFLPTQVATSKGGSPIRTDSFVYSAYGTSPATSKGLLSTKTVAVGSIDQAVTNFTYSGAGFMTQQIVYTGTADPNDVTTFTYNSRGELTNAADADGRSTTFTYDGMSRPTSKTVKNEAAQILGTWTMSYTGNGELAQTTGPHVAPANSVLRTYDAAGRLIEEAANRSQAKPDGTGVTAAPIAITSFGYDLVGNRILSVDPNSHSTTMSYDGIGQLLSKTTGGLRAESFKYEPGGSISEYTNPLGGVTKHFYTQTGKLRRQENPDGSVLEWLYGTDGRIQKEILRNGAYWETARDDLNRIVTRTFKRADGTVLSTESRGYDRRGNLISFTDSEGFVRSTTYDGLNRVKSSTGPAAVVGSAQQVGTFNYGVSAKTVTALNALNEQVVTTSDALGRPLQINIKTAAGTTVRATTYVYSADNNAVAFTEGSGSGAIARTTWTDAFNRTVLTVLGDGSFIRSVYDPAGNLLSSTDALNQTTAYSYNVLDQMSTQTLPDGTVTSFTYDGANNLRTRAMGNGTLVHEQTYDSASRKVSEQLYSATATTRQYSYTYCPAGDPAVGLLKTVTNPRDTATTVYDDFLRPQTVTTSGVLPETNTATTYTFDRRGLATAINQSSVASAAGPATQVSRIYDGYGQLLTETVTAGGVTAASVMQTWDGAGRRTLLDESSATRPAPLFSWQYRADGLLTQVVSNGQSYAFNYADNGLLTGRMNPFRTLAVNSRDAVGRITQQTQTVGATTPLVETMTWRTNSTLNSYTATRTGTGAWNESRAYQYNSRGQLLSEGFSPLASVTNAFGYTFDGNNPGLGIRLDAWVGTGAPVSWETNAMVDTLGRVTADVQTSPSGGAPGRVVAASGTATGADHIDVLVDGVLQGRASYASSAWSINVNMVAGSHTLTANAVDPSGLYTTRASSTFTVTAANPNEPTGTVTNSFDNDGNVISRSWASGQVQTLAWDAFGRLIKVTQRDGSNNGYDWTAVFDGLGRRLTTTHQPVTAGSVSGSPTVTNSVFDPEVQFLEIGVAVNGAKAWKVYGRDLDGFVDSQQGIGGLEATIVDGGGATKGVINDVFGNGVASVSGSTVSWFATRVGGYGPLPGSSAEILTDITRLAEASAWRSRRIDPTGFYHLGFRDYDPIGGRWLSTDPLGHDTSLSLYDYCSGDPINGVDPLGLLTRQQWAGTAERLYSAGGAANWWKAVGIVVGDSAFDLFSMGNWSRNDRLLDRNLNGEISDYQFWQATKKNTAVGLASVLVGNGAAALLKGTGSLIVQGAAAGFAQSAFQVVGDRIGDKVLSISHEGSWQGDLKTIGFTTVLGAAFGAAARGDVIIAAKTNIPRTQPEQQQEMKQDIKELRGLAKGLSNDQLDILHEMMDDAKAGEGAGAKVPTKEIKALVKQVKELYPKK